MNMLQWVQLLWQQLCATDAIQWIAIIFGVAEVLLARSNNIWLYPTGIISTLLTIYSYLHAGLYAESALNGYYVIMSVYGWWYWVKKRDQPPIKITYSNRQEWIVVSAIVVGGFLLLAWLLKYFLPAYLAHYITPSTVPLWDAWVSATAWAGMWLLARRKIENWILLNISNAFAVPLLFYKHLPLYALLYVFLFIVAVQGYVKWRKLIIFTTNGNRTEMAGSVHKATMGKEST